jgi:uncharacterized membrane protein YjjB (DUF3815 family)
MVNEAGASLPVSSLVAALLVGTTAAVVAPRTDQATPIYSFAPVIPLIPGTYIFTALQAAIELTELTPNSPETGAVVDAAMVSVATATLTIVALAVGAIAPGLLIGQHLARLAEVIPSATPHHRGRTGTSDD